MQELIPVLILSGVRRQPNGVEGPHARKEYHRPLGVFPPRTPVDSAYSHRGTEECAFIRRARGEKISTEVWLTDSCATAERNVGLTAKRAGSWFKCSLGR